LLAGAVFQALFVTFTRHWLTEELEFRTRAVAAALAERVATPLAVNDTNGLREKIASAAATTGDVVAIEVLDAGLRPRARLVAEPARWRAMEPLAHAESQGVRLRVWRAGGAGIHELVVPVNRHV